MNDLVNDVASLALPCHHTTTIAKQKGKTKQQYLNIKENNNSTC